MSEEQDAARRLITEIVRITATPGCEDLVLRHFKVERDGDDLLEHIQSLVDGAGRSTSDAGTKVLAEVCAERTRERDEARRLLLVMADACRKAHDLNLDIDGGALHVVDAVESAIVDGIDSWEDLEGALRRVCGSES